MDAVIVLGLLCLVVVDLALVVVVMDDGVASVPCWVDTVDAVVILGLLSLVGILLALVVVVSNGMDNGGGVVP